jgi:hypothetical protein
MSILSKFGEVPPVIKGVITDFVFRVLAPWWQSGESHHTEYRMEPSLTPQQYAYEK